MIFIFEEFENVHMYRVCYDKNNVECHPEKRDTPVRKKWFCDVDNLYLKRFSKFSKSMELQAILPEFTHFIIYLKILILS